MSRKHSDTIIYVCSFVTVCYFSMHQYGQKSFGERCYVCVCKCMILYDQILVNNELYITIVTHILPMFLNKDGLNPKTVL